MTDTFYVIIPADRNLPIERVKFEREDFDRVAREAIDPVYDHLDVYNMPSLGMTVWFDDDGASNSEAIANVRLANLLNVANGEPGFILGTVVLTSDRITSAGNAIGLDETRATGALLTGEYNMHRWTDDMVAELSQGCREQASMGFVTMIDFSERSE